LSSKGQIAIPKAVREQMRLTEGTKLTLSLRGQNIILRRAGLADWRSWRGRLRGAKLGEQLERDHREEIQRDEAMIRDAKSS